MPKKSPKYRRCRRRDGRADLAYIEVHGRRHYLGEYDSPESRERYHRALAELAASGFVDPGEDAQLAIVELIARFVVHAEGYYRHADGTPTGELDNFRPALRALRDLYGSMLVSDFGPRALKAVRETFVSRKLARSYINNLISRIKHLFRWGVAEELVPSSVYHALQAVAGLRRGRSAAREPEPVVPVALEDVEAIRPYVARQVWAVVRLQLVTGARPGELLPMRATEIERHEDGPWCYVPASHKNAHRGQPRTIWVGPRGQEVLRPFIAARPVGACLFSPEEAEHERRAAAHAERVTPLSCGNRPGSRRSSNPRQWREHYTTQAYRRAIVRACKAAGVEEWHPHQLRHNVATEVQRRWDAEAARVVLGHADLKSTEIYIERDRDIARSIAAKLG